MTTRRKKAESTTAPGSHSIKKLLARRNMFTAGSVGATIAVSAAEFLLLAAPEQKAANINLSSSLLVLI